MGLEGLGDLMRPRCFKSTNAFQRRYSWFESKRVATQKRFRRWKWVPASERRCSIAPWIDHRWWSQGRSRTRRAKAFLLQRGHDESVGPYARTRNADAILYRGTASRWYAH